MSKINENYANFMVGLLEKLVNNFGYDLLENKSHLMNEILLYIEDQNYLPNFDFREIYKYMLVNHHDSIAVECMNNYLEKTNEIQNDRQDNFIFDFMNEDKE